MTVPSSAPDKGVSRRDALKKGAAVGGALLWATPVVQTIGMTRAYAAGVSGSGEEAGPSYIALNVDCGGRRSTGYSIKYEGCTAPDDCFETDPGRTPGCEGLFDFEGVETDGDALGFVVDGPHPDTGCVTIIVPAGCTVTESVIKKGQECCPGPRGSGTLIFCPCF
jgi:hypothetical protein